MKIIKNKFAYIAVAVVAVVAFILFFLWGGGISVVYAATSTATEFEQSDVMDDLKTATINGKSFDTVNYPYDSTGIVKHPEIMTVVEYCYSIRAAQRGNYGVYVYFYNPQALNISTVSMVNKITLGVKYGTDKDGNIKVEDYEKFALQFCSKSTGDFHDLFYKFKVVDHKSADGKTIAERVNSNARRYDISEIELLTVGDRNATAYSVGGTYTFTGYAKGYGVDENAESTLTCERADLETITLDLAGVTDGVDKRTYWRSNSSSTGKNHQNQINSVFFAIDTNVLEKYGYTLQKIKAEWWEYKTVPAVVVDDNTVFNSLENFSGTHSNTDKGGTWVWNSYNKNSTVAGTRFLCSYSWHFDTTTGYKDELMPLLFSTRGVPVDNYVLTAKTLQSYCEKYNKSYEKGHLQINEHDFSADLFMDTVDDGRTRGYNLREFDISNPDDLWQINSYDNTHNWWQKFLDYGFGLITTNDDYPDTKPIEMLTDEHFAAANVADYLKINPDDVDRLEDYYNKSIQDRNGDGKPDNAVFLFRYAQTDYWAEDLHITHRPIDGKASEYEYYNSCAEIRQGTQFFDFDILTMTFNKNGDLTTLGCVSSPVDHWSAYTPSIEPKLPNLGALLKLILAIIAIILIVVLLYKLAVLLVPAISSGRLRREVRRNTKANKRKKE